VVIDRKADPDRCCSVSVDDFAGGSIAVKHLLELGRRRIGFVGNLAMQQVSDRLAGAMAAIKEFGSDAQLQLLESDDMSVIAGRAVGDQIRQAPFGDRPDAIFASNDLLAMGLVQAFVLNGDISIPGDIAIIGYDDISWAEAAVVPLSSIRQPSRLIGETAVQLVLEEINNGVVHKHQQVTFQPELVVRASTRS
jgi:LacI family transcriptional regulator